MLPFWRSIEPIPTALLCSVRAEGGPLLDLGPQLVPAAVSSADVSQIWARSTTSQKHTVFAVLNLPCIEIGEFSHADPTSRSDSAHLSITLAPITCA